VQESTSFFGVLEQWSASAQRLHNNTSLTVLRKALTIHDLVQVVEALPPSKRDVRVR